MADPVSVPLTKDIWNPAATNVTGGMLMIISHDPKIYSWTYVMNGNPPPANSDFSNAAVMDNQQPFSFAAAVDLYVMPRSEDGSISRWV